MSAALPAVLLILLIAAAPAPLHAQEAAADSAALAAVAAHVDAARFDSARTALDAWHRARRGFALQRDRSTADLLAARLERDGVAAQHAYLALALAHPFGEAAALSLLRVGQAAVLQGDTAAAFVYLSRLIDDFPGGNQGAEAHLWLSRAYLLAGRATHGCEAARAGLASSASAEVQRLLRIQETRACAPGPAATASDGERTTPTTGERGFAVQTGAFRSRSGADALLGRLRRAGFEARLVRVPGSELTRVRVGVFTTAADATRLRERLRSGGFDAVVVDDATRETPVP